MPAIKLLEFLLACVFVAPFFSKGLFGKLLEALSIDPKSNLGVKIRQQSYWAVVFAVFVSLISRSVLAGLIASVVFVVLIVLARPKS